MSNHGENKMATTSTEEDAVGESLPEQDTVVSDIVLEGDIIQGAADRNEQRLSVDSALSSARSFLQSQIGANGDNMFSLLLRLIAKLLVVKPDGAVDFFEEYCRLVKQEHFLPPEAKVRDVPGAAEHDRQVDFAKQVLRYVSTLGDPTLLTPEALSIRQLSPIWAQVGFALPPSVDFFIDRQINHLCTSGGKTRQVRFWGVIHGLTEDYYVVEREQDNLEALQLEHELDLEKSAIARELIDGLIRGTVSDESLVHDWCGAESMAMEMIERILEGAIPPDTDVELATAVAVPVMDGLLEQAIDAAQEPEVELSVMGSLEVVSCNATVESSELSLDQLKFASLRTLVEVKLNVFQYFVSRNPFRDDWVQLPGINLDKIVASRESRSYFKGELEAPVRGGARMIPTEREYLRAVLARISMDRFRVETAVPRLMCNRDVAVFYKATGFPQPTWDVKELNHPATPRTVWRRSSIWPGSFVFGGADHIYFGWGGEERSI